MNTTAACLIAIVTFSKITFAVANQNNERTQFGIKLSDCGALFGLISQGDSSHSNTMRNFSIASVLYAQTAINDDLAYAKQVQLSMKKAADYVTYLQESDNKDDLKNELTLCFSSLEKAEKTLRSEMSELNKGLAPEMFN
jgi:hypothetical protein